MMNLTLDEAKKIAAQGDYKVIPISCEIFSDVKTPIEVLRILKNISRHVYMLESIEDNEKWGRYTFLGYDPKLELTCLKDHPQAYELGENESHLCFRVAGDYEAIHQYHKEMGWVCFENTAMGLYFIHDPDDYWIEVLPAK